MTSSGCEIIRAIRFPTGASLILVMTSCATQSEFAGLTYPPNDYADAAASEARQSAQVGCSAILNVSDERSNKEQIGTLSGGLVGEFRAPVLTGDSVEVWVYDAFSFELNALGLKVIDSGMTSDHGEIGMFDIAIMEITSSCYAVSCGATMDLTVTLTSPGGEIRKTSQHSNQRSAGFRLSYIPILEEALRKSLHESIERVFADLQLGNLRLCSSSRGHSVARTLA